MTIYAAQPSRTPTELTQVARIGDRVMYAFLFAETLAALAIGQYFGDLTSALTASALIVLLGGAVYFTAQGTALSRLVLTSCNVALVALHIQLGRGTLEFHFGVFVLLGLLLVYRDWRPIVLAAGLFAVHHVAFDRLQAAGWGVYCTPQADFLKTLMHAVYVVAQTGVEIVLALSLRQATVEASELIAIVSCVDQDGKLCLDVDAMPASAPASSMLKSMLLKMESAVADVNHAAASIECAATEIATGNLDLSQRTEEQASNLQSTAASMEQLTGTVKSTSETAARADEIASSASTAAAEGGQVVGKVVATMSDISNSSKRIADITGVIDGIAFQTNILALNAAVEAARAGEQGRGFAVVASEVRSLAQRSAEAAKEIKVLISASVENVEVGTRLVSDAGISMRNIVEQTGRVSELIGVISQATREQTTGIEQVGGSVSQLDSVTQQNSALVEQGAAAAESLQQQAVRLNNVVQRFTLGAHALARD